MNVLTAPTANALPKKIKKKRLIMFIKLKAFLSKLAERREKRKELNVVLSIYELFLDYNPADFTYVGSISEYQQKLLEDLDFTVEHKADRVILKKGTCSAGT